MVKGFMTILIVAVVSLGLVFVAGCESDAQTGALIGTAAGAGIGQAIGHDTESTLIGAGVGAAGGYMIGNEQDKKKARAETKAEMESLRQEMNVVTINVTNSNGSITPVRLRKQGVVYIGPRGETYTTLPTEEQLKQGGYGF